jgi:excinuclease ABC subunit A
VIEHNLDVIKTADWIIDLGPEGGAGGGQVIAQGTPEAIAGVDASYTGRYLKPVLVREGVEIDRANGKRRTSAALGRGRTVSGDLLG